MEFLLLWWDELDDLTHACRHLATCAIAEAAARAAPLGQVVCGLGAALLVQLNG
ncbi:MAG TPA: hypothetical protein VIY54_10445 [Steroidobacteraceae bacterium]